MGEFMANDVDKDPELDKLLERKAREMIKNVNNTGGVVELNRSNFDEFIKTHEVAVVDFWATWCAPCFMLEPIIKRLAAEMPNVGFGRLNTEEEPEIAAKYYVMSLPTVIIFKNGEPIDQVIGVVPKKILQDRIKAYLND
ncbi:thioredoxin [Caldivirga maquilingensis IC-167]|uniref:Thioredoxin n=2 Tax=Caldivirga maquilingensis TaxID=76887 RepID=A8M9L7_CALMQ|nr:thioredoxin [Caldivirga maquilingensis IC-167]